MACAVYLREVIIFTTTFHIVCISNYKSLKSIDDHLYKKIIDAKSKQDCKLSTRYTAEDKRVWRYCNNNYCRIKDGFNIVTSQTERKIVSTTVAQVITVTVVEKWMTSIRLWYDLITSCGRRVNIVSTSYLYWNFY